MHNDRQQSPASVIKGKAVHAIYREPKIPSYQGNPLIEALPPVFTTEQATSRLSHYPQYDEAQRNAPDHIRYHLIQNGMRFFAPLDIHLDLERRFSCLLRVGYAGRNPLSIGFWNELDSRITSFDQYEKQYNTSQKQPLTTAAGFSIVGISGIGKSQSVLRVLSLYPQVIHHSRYVKRNFTHSQITWIKLDCPYDGTIKGLCINFFQAVDEILGTHNRKHYAQNKISIDEMVVNMAVVEATHFIGLLVIDEIQRLSQAKSGGAEKMLNFFVQLVNTIGVPIVLVGNYKALPILSGDFSQMRRGTGQGDLIWDRMAQDDQWELFVESLWRFQYTRKRCFLDKDPSLSSVLYEETQGITDFAVKVYMFAQERAIDSKKEIITASIIRSAAKDNLRIPREVLTALKNGDKRVLANYEDLYHQALQTYVHKHEEHLSVKGNLSSSPEAMIPGKSNLKPESRQYVLQPPLEGAHKRFNTPQANKSDKGKRGQKSKSKTKIPQVATKGGLLEIISALGARNCSSAYEALQDAGYIRHADEYF